MAESLGQLLLQVSRDKTELTAILESMSEGVIAADLKQQILLVNDAAGRLLGFAPNEAAGKNLWELIRDPLVIKSVRDIATEGGRLTVTVSPLAGRKLEVTLSAFPTHGRAEGIVLVAHDVTESSRYQELRKEFVANVSHELRTPLTVIRGFVETLQDGALNDPARAAQFSGDDLEAHRSISQPGRRSARAVQAGEPTDAPPADQRRSRSGHPPRRGSAFPGCRRARIMSSR